jgi:hypothetical protein
MVAVPFDTPALARKLETAGFPSKQAQDTAAALADVMGSAELVTKDYLDSKLREVEQRLTIRTGGMLVVATGILLAANFFA